MQVAATIMKSNADAEKFAVQTLLGAGASSLANVGAVRRRRSRYFALNPLLPSFRGARWREPQMCNCASEVRLLHSRATSPEHAAVADWFRFRTIHARVPREGVLAGHYRYPVLSPVCNMNGTMAKPPRIFVSMAWILRMRLLPSKIRTV